jgi:hypothetical protein
MTFILLLLCINCMHAFLDMKMHVLAPITILIFKQVQELPHEQSEFKPWGSPRALRLCCAGVAQHGRRGVARGCGC